MSIKRIAILLCVLFVLPVAAQDTPAGCEAATVVEALAQQQAQLAQAENALGEGDIESALELMRQAGVELARTHAACSGLAFEGNGSRVIGPVTFESGVYRVTVTMGEYTLIDIQRLDGDCGGVGDVTPLTRGMQTNEEHIFRSENCTGLIQVESMEDDDWEVSFELISDFE
jgi:hypothetical protein